MNLIGIQNVGEFYSHHYLDTLLEKDLKGLFERWRDEDETTPDRRLNRHAGEFFTAKRDAQHERRPEDRYPVSHSLHVKLLEALGYSYSFTLRYLLDGTAVPVLGVEERDGRDYLWLVETVFADEDQSPLEQPVFEEQYQFEFQTYIVDTQSLPGLAVAEKRASYGAGTAGEEVDRGDLSRPGQSWEELAGEIFRAAEPPRWLILLAGRFIYLIDRTKWGQGKYLLFDLDEIFGRRERETLRATAALLAREALCPADSLPLHDTLDENSHKHAYGVSTDLKYGVRQAVELLANEYVWYQRNVRKEKLFGDDELGRKLTGECLTYLYRLLFLFYVEAHSLELDVVPMKSDAYRTGYSLEALRDLEQVPLTTPQAENGYFLHESLARLFRLVNDGYAPGQLKLAANGGSGQADKATSQPSNLLTFPPANLYHDYGFDLRGLKSPLFDPKATPLLSSVRFRNLVLQQVLQLLSLSRQGQRGQARRGRISYAQLGINQLGAVYEGLLSYTGFFAQEELYEVRPAGAGAADETAQAYFVPAGELERYEPEEFVYVDGPDGSRVRKMYPRGSFIYRLAGRDREKSASYYTPEVLTRCLVKYSLKELLQGKSADDILALTLCEPAMGSGAFINEALNQLADAYLERKQQELGRQIPPDGYREERQKVKAHLALHNAYGVDLKPLAVKLAQVSLWLNTIYRGQRAPWFGPRLVVGNSLIGARRQVYTAEDVLSGDYAGKAPTPVPLGQPRPAGSVYHWLLPDAGMAAFDKDKVIRELAPEQVDAIKAWRKRFTAKISREELKNMQALSDRADALWLQHLRERQALLGQTRELIPVWGQGEEPRISRKEGEVDREGEPAGGAGRGARVVSLDIAAKEEALSRLERPASPYRRLKLAMDYWCALWFWPIPEADRLPDRREFLNDVADLFAGAESEFEQPPEQLSLLDPDPLPRQAHFAEVKQANVAELLETNPRLGLAANVAGQQWFHHWELAFAEVFAGRGGFDLIVGNPPWVKVRWEQLGVLSDMDPFIAVNGFNTSDAEKERPRLLKPPANRALYLDEFVEQTGSKNILGDASFRQIMGKMSVNLCTLFIVVGWRIGSKNGIVGFLHDQGPYSSGDGEKFRTNIYKHLKYYFHFHNEENLFRDVDHTKKFEMSIFKATEQSTINFLMIVNLFHPITIDLSLTHDGAGIIPGIKTTGNDWELNGHKDRVISITEQELGAIAGLYEEEGTPSNFTRLPQIHSKQILSVIEKLHKHKEKFASLREDIFYGIILHETDSLRSGKIVERLGRPKSVKDWIVSPPQIYVATPIAQEAKENYRNRQDYVEVNFTEIVDDFLPRSIYQSGEGLIDATIAEFGKDKVGQYRLINRTMVLSTFERTLISAILPPYVAHINNCWSNTFKNHYELCVAAAFTASIVLDFIVKTIAKLHVYTSVLDILPVVHNPPMQIISRILRLNCLTTCYSLLWEELYTPVFNEDSWAKNDPRLSPWYNLTDYWQRNVALRTPFERRQALVEIDVLAAMALDLTLDELLTIYRVQFPVLQKNERRLLFDQRGMEVPVKTSGGELRPDEDHPRFAEMVPPFTPVDREGDYREAWGYFEEKIKQD